MEQIRIHLKTFLRDHLLGKENQDTKERFIQTTGFTNENIKGYVNLNIVACPPFTKFPEIADFFNVSIYELLGIENPSDLSPEEMELIKNYRNASPELQKAARNIFK